MADKTNGESGPKTLDPETLDGLHTTEAGVKTTSVGEDGDVLLLGHHDDDAAWAAFLAFQQWYVQDDDFDQRAYVIERKHASFSDHSGSCDLVDCTCDEVACEPCRAGDHAGCTDPDACECAAGYDHEFEGGWPCQCECYCDEYAWWVETTKSGHEVTWVRWSWEKAKALRLSNRPSATTGGDDRG